MRRLSPLSYAAFAALLAAASGASASEQIFETWNTAACEVTDTAAFSIDSPVHLDSIELWYRWGADERSVDYTVAFNGKAIGVGTLVRGDCDPRQEAWCLAHAEPGAKLVPGSYTIKTKRARICRNAASGGQGFIRAFGSRQKTQPAPEVSSKEPAPGPAEQKAPSGESGEKPLISEETLFDGKLDGRWVQHSAEGGDFDRDARIENGALVVKVAEGNGDGNVGILSPKALVWLDDFGRKAETTVTFNFDPVETTGLAVSLAIPGYGEVRGNPPAAPDVTMTWSRAVDGASAKADFYLNIRGRSPFKTLTLPARAPSKVSVKLRPREVAWSVDDGEEIVAAFPEARAGQGLHIYAYSQAAVRNAAVSMKLTSIVLHQTRDPARGATRDVERAVIFDGKESPLWEPFGREGGDFSKFARYQNGLLVVDVPAGNWWGETGIVSANPVLHPERFSDIAPYRFTVHADPARTSGFAIAFGSERVHNWWSHHTAWTSLIRGAAGRYVLTLRYSPYETWERTVPGPWNGDLVITIGADGITAEIPEGPSIRAPRPFIERADYYAGIFSRPTAAGEASSIALRSITRERLIPADLPPAELWKFVPSEQFDPNAFLSDLGKQLQ